MINALFIVWREVIEAMLVVGVLHAWIANQRELVQVVRLHAQRWLWAGIVVGILFAVGLAAILLGLQEWADGQALEWVQTLLPIIASALILNMVIWMRQHGKGFKKELEANASAAVRSSHWISLALLAAIAVGREGAETVVFLYGAASGDVLVLDVVIGSSLGLLLAFIFYFLLVRGGRWLSWAVFFRVTEFLLLLLGGSLLVDGCEKLVGMGVLPALIDPLWNSSSWLNDNGLFGGVVAKFTGWRARPIGIAYLALLAWWLYAWLGILRR